MYTIPAGQQQYIRGQIPQGVVLNSPGIGPNNQHGAEDASRKREMRLMKNRSDMSARKFYFFESFTVANLPYRPCG